MKPSTKRQLTALAVTLLTLNLSLAEAASEATNSRGRQALKGAINTGVTGQTGPQGPAGLRGPAGSSQPGNNIGDMQYWDGSTWVIIPAPSPAPKAPLMATLYFCNGIPSWVDNCSVIFHIGDNGPAGGKVFYLSDKTGFHGLEAAPTDQSSGAVWGCYNKLIGASGTAVGTGAANTAAIVAGCSEANTAAKIADAYVLNGYTDWYLPSQDELNLLYQQKTVVGGFVVGGFANNNYWSSSQYSSLESLRIASLTAWNQYFSNGNQDYNNKGSTLPVRAVRAF
jgi:Protein of unknown function (DUF1566)